MGSDRLTVVCWKWKPFAGYRSMFDGSHVDVLRRMVRRHYDAPHDFVCVTDDPTGITEPDVRIVPLWSDHAELPSPHDGPRRARANPSCYRRLKMFSAEAGQLLGPRMVSVDLDCVVTGDLRPLWDRPEPFVAWGDTNPANPYNGSMILHTAGARRELWDDFHPERSPDMARRQGFFGSDQAWICSRLGPGEARWGKADGVYSYRMHLKPAGGALPPDARLVFFHGAVDPWDHEAQALEWVRRNWT